MQLRSYQMAAVRWLIQRRGRGLLAFEMGTGKTPTTLATIGVLRKGRVLVLAPKIACGVWMREAETWLPGWPTTLYTGAEGPKKRQATWDRYVASGGLLVTSLSMAKELVERQADWPVVVIDESHLIRNRKTKTFEALKKLRSGAMILLTGSPIVNHPTDLWSQLYLVDPQQFSSFWRFAKEHFEVYADRYSAWNIGDYLDPEHTQAALAPYMLRKTKEEVLTELPPKTRQAIPVPLAKDQRRLYDDLAEDMMAEMEALEEGGESLLLSPNVVSKITRLRQICVTPALVGDAHSSAMFDALAEYAEADFDAGKPILVFTPFAEAIPYIEAALKTLDRKPIKRDADGVSHPGRCVAVYRIRGGLSSEAMASEVDGFQGDPNPARALICTTGVGSSFTATAAKGVYFIGSAWTPAQNLQCEDRAHRFGQTDPVLVRYFVGEGTIDEHVMATLDRKTTWAALALDPKMLLLPTGQRVKQFVERKEASA